MDAHNRLTPEDVEQIIHKALRDHSSPKKNGESWAQWFWRGVSLQQLILLVLAVVTAVWQVSGYVRDIEDSIAKIEVIQRAQEVLRADLKANVQSIAELLLRDQSHATKEDVRSIAETQALGITRQEMRGALNQQIIPRLDAMAARIDKLERAVAAAAAAGR